MESGGFYYHTCYTNYDLRFYGLESCVQTVLTFKFKQLTFNFRLDIFSLKIDARNTD